MNKVGIIAPFCLFLLAILMVLLLPQSVVYISSMTNLDNMISMDLYLALIVLDVVLAIYAALQR